MSTQRTIDSDWWASLKHGGMLIAPSRLAQYFGQLPEPINAYIEERLRRALTRAETIEGRAVDASLLDTVLEQVIGLKDGNDYGWKSGSDVDKRYSRPALTGEIVRPRRIWLGPRGAMLPVFVDTEARIGIGRGRRMVSRVIEWLRGSNGRIALLTNGRQWRILAAGPDWDAWAEADTALWFEEGRSGAQLTALRALIGPRALTPERSGEPAPLQTAIDESRRGQAELSAELGERVRQAVELLIQSHGTALSAASALTPRDIYIAATRVVMRMVVALFAEARDLLPRDNAIYHHSYGLQGLRESLERVGSADIVRLRHRHGAWPRVLALFRLIYHGSYHPGLPVARYGGGLFRPGDAQADDAVHRALAVLEDPEYAPDDAVVYHILTLLCRADVRVRQGAGVIRVLTPVDFSDLSSEYIGILYEGLLDYELRRDREPIVFLAVGDEPALPLARLEAMSDTALADLFSKFKKPSKQAGGEVDEDAGEEEDAEAEPEEETADEAPETELTEPEPAALDNDAHRQTRGRALRWARRAAVACRLIPANAAQLPLGDDDADGRVASTLIRRVIPAGEWFLVRWGGTRKGSGTFYTRPALAVPTVHRTLRPLAYTPPIGADGTLDEDANFALWTPKLPEEILRLKVCDPAMGSGSFLTAALRFLTDALFRSLFVHDRIRPDGEGALVDLFGAINGDGRLSDEHLPRRPDADDFEARLRAVLKRHVVERCLYGVDLDPLAVELGRLALWVETMDHELPFEFLDHKLKRGNALIGCWFDRFQDYPALAYRREGGDKSHKGTHYAADSWTKAIAAFKEDTVKPALHAWVSPQCTMLTGVEGQSPESLHQAASATLDDMHALSVREMEERERLYGEMFDPTTVQAQLRRIFDAWCAVWFWPANALALAPLPSDFARLTPECVAVVAELQREYGFFHWELEFPDVFTGEGAGFDAVIGNPPWEIQKPNSLEFFSNHDPLYRTYGKQQAIARQQELFAQDASVEQAWLQYNARFKALSNWFGSAGDPFGDYIDMDGRDVDSTDRFALIKTWRKTDNYALHNIWRLRRNNRTTYSDRRHPFRHQGSADINTYKLFAEVGHAVSREGGQLGFIVPSGLYTDKGTAALRRLFLDRCRWRWLFGFENREGIFDIHRAFKFCPIIVKKGGKTEAIHTAFMRRRLDDWENAEIHSILYTREQVTRFSPHTLSILEIRGPEDLAVLERIYASSVLLGDAGPDAWRIKYACEFHMTNNSKLFPPLPKWKERGFVPDIYGRWLKVERIVPVASDEVGWIRLREGGFVHEDSIEEIALPLYEGRMIGQFDFSQKGWVSGKGRGSVWRDIPVEEKVIEPQYLMSDDTYVGECANAHTPKVVMMDVTSATNTRTAITTTLVGFPCGHKTPTMTPQSSTVSDALALSALMNSYVFDFQIRNRLGGQSLIWAVLAETGIGQMLVEHRLLLTPFCARLELGSEGWALQWLQLRAVWPPIRSSVSPWRALWAITPHERLRLRCIIDAVVAALFGIKYDDLLWILRDCDHPVATVNNMEFARTLDGKGFWRLDKDQPPELRHTVLTLAAFRDLKTLIDANDCEREEAIEVFCTMNNGDGWMLPETLRLADLGLGHDNRAQESQPVREKLGLRFLDWQLEQSVEESWAECERHARNLLGKAGYAALQSELKTPPKEFLLAAETRAEYQTQEAQDDDFELVAPDYTPQGKLPI